MAIKSPMPFLYPQAVVVPRVPAPRLNLLPITTTRHATGVGIGGKRAKDQHKKKKARTDFINQSLKDAMQFSLCDAMRYIKAFEVGRPPTSSKYDLAIRLRTIKNGPIIRNRLRFPHVVDSSVRICVICPPDSVVADQARKAGATIAGEDIVLDAVKDGRVEFDRCICHVDSATKLNTANVGRILGPKGLMPSVKLGTITKDVDGMVRGMIGGTEYKERLGVVRCAVGQLKFTPEEMQANIKALIEGIKKDIALLSDRIGKDIHEVVLSSTNAPGFSLNGDFRSPDSPSTKDLAVI